MARAALHERPAGPRLRPVAPDGELLAVLSVCLDAAERRADGLAVRGAYLASRIAAELGLPEDGEPTSCSRRCSSTWAPPAEPPTSRPAEIEPSRRAVEGSATGTPRCRPTCHDPRAPPPRCAPWASRRASRAPSSSSGERWDGRGPSGRDAHHLSQDGRVLALAALVAALGHAPPPRRRGPCGAARSAAGPWIRASWISCWGWDVAASGPSSPIPASRPPCWHWSRGPSDGSTTIRPRRHRHHVRRHRGHAHPTDGPPRPPCRRVRRAHRAATWGSTPRFVDAAAGGAVPRRGQAVGAHLLSSRSRASSRTRSDASSRSTHGPRRAVLGRSRALARLAPLVVAHHERLDGNGMFPTLVDPPLAMAARVLALCDRYEAMTAERPYRPLCRPPRCGRSSTRWWASRWPGSGCGVMRRAVVERAERCGLLVTRCRRRARRTRRPVRAMPPATSTPQPPGSEVRDAGREDSLAGVPTRMPTSARRAGASRAPSRRSTARGRPATASGPRP